MKPEREALLTEAGKENPNPNETPHYSQGGLIKDNGVNPPVYHSLPQTGYVRLPQIVGDNKTGIPPIIPVSKSTWWAGVKSGRYPKPVKLSERCTAWRVEDIRSLIKRACADRT